ncbi:hypothetical protein [Hyalangium sp.]|uniref:hypothetical protein n=1 Tax=Hyalangium sp. TaxID=2028555 RepID=UPI002D66D397|nr:hypothetical protein [Hyalangium sp.]HYH98764.1 hypothetical protein [Hyalangium sp.]
MPYRQWTQSFPHRVRWMLLKDVGLLSDVLTVFLRAVFALLYVAMRVGLQGRDYTALEAAEVLRAHVLDEPACPKPAP